LEGFADERSDCHVVLRSSGGWASDRCCGRLVQQPDIAANGYPLPVGTQVITAAEIRLFAVRTFVVAATWTGKTYFIDRAKRFDREEPRVAAVTPVSQRAASVTR
jgi:hypothetical protein